MTLFMRRPAAVSGFSNGRLSEEWSGSRALRIVSFSVVIFSSSDGESTCSVDRRDQDSSGSWKHSLVESPGSGSSDLVPWR